MGHKELTEALLREGEELVLEIRKNAEQEAGRIASESGERLGKMRSEFDKAMKDAAAARAEAILAAAEERAADVELRAETDLSERLYRIAASSLASLREGNYPAVFSSLAQELPAHEWHIVRVNPKDMELGAGHFPGSAIVPDNTITGGFEAASVRDTIIIVNTFEKRLERAWPDIAPALIEEVLRTVAGRTKP